MAELRIYDFRVSTMSWGNIYNLRVVATTKARAQKIVEEKYKDWRIQDMQNSVPVREGTIL